MTLSRRLAALAMVAALCSDPPLAGAATLAAQEKAALQAAMQHHIDRQLVQGAYLYLVPGSGQVRVLHPVTSHPMILRMGAHFVLCADFIDAVGRPVNVDFYLAPRGNGYVVFHAAVAQRAQLEAWMKSGKVKPAD